MQKQIVITEHEWTEMQMRVAFFTARLVNLYGESPFTDYILNARRQFDLSEYPEPPR